MLRGLSEPRLQTTENQKMEVLSCSGLRPEYIFNWTFLGNYRRIRFKVKLFSGLKTAVIDHRIDAVGVEDKKARTRTNVQVRADAVRTEPAN